ncbi:MAG TPA: ATP-binding protein [Kofleriaceae bacterium]|nr:ATP-binding protein [Kofleriaceae bacterium]
MKILIVDGSREQRLHLVQVLGAVTNIVIQGAVSDMRSALHAVVEASPDVIVTGAALPDGDGAELIASVRKLARSPSFVVVAGEPSDELRARYLAAGVDRYLEAPQDARALQVAVSTLRRRATGSIPPEETQRLLGRMTSGVVHDLNNYLHVLDVTFTLLRRHPEDPQLWKQIQSAILAMGRLNATLLAYARGSALAPALVDLAALARDTVAVLGRVIPADIVVRFDIDDQLPPVQGVRSELEQLVLNLVMNATDAMPKGGELVISLKRSAGAVVVLEITDTGAGVAVLPTNGRSQSTKRDGVGLGLGIAQAVVDRHRGALNVSPLERGGTKAIVMFPTTRSLTKLELRDE